jgi:hypothetical protein
MDARPISSSSSSALIISRALIVFSDLLLRMDFPPAKSRDGVETNPLLFVLSGRVEVKERAARTMGIEKFKSALKIVGIVTESTQ